MNPRITRILHLILVAISEGTAMAGCIFGLMFYKFYLIWIPLFENGRYFDLETNVVYTESGQVHGIIMFVSSNVAIASALVDRSLR